MKSFKKYELGFFRIASVSPPLKVAGITCNVENIKMSLNILNKKGVNLVVFPELSITSYSCGDLFFKPTILNNAIKGLFDLVEFSKNINCSFIVGIPIEYNSRLYNSAAFILNGEILGIVPKQHIPNCGEYYEQRWFASGINIINSNINIKSLNIPWGTDLIFTDQNNKYLKIAIEICEDLWVANPPSSNYSLAGATIIANLSASSKILSKNEYINSLVKIQSAKCLNCYIYSGASADESTTDMVFSGYQVAAQFGHILYESESIGAINYYSISDCDLNAISHERAINSSWKQQTKIKPYRNIYFQQQKGDNSNDIIYSLIKKRPFIPLNNANKALNEIIKTTSLGILKRIKHTKIKKIIIGVSGGLDSTLTLLISILAIKDIPKCTIKAISMPGEGSSNQTKSNSKKLCKLLNIELITIPITNIVNDHLEAINWKNNDNLITYENAQARERTQILMDLANLHNGLVVGTSDMSEIALGWGTYNADFMSMYHLIGGIPKTLVQHLIVYLSKLDEFKSTKNVLKSILDTPISPELLPLKNNKISQETENIIGKFELHDFFLFYFLRYGYSPKKLYFIGKNLFNIPKAEFLNTLSIFFDRFIKNQFKRSTLPDFPKVGTISLSARTDLKLPSDSDIQIWKDELKSINY